MTLVHKMETTLNIEKQNSIIVYYQSRVN